MSYDITGTVKEVGEVQTFSSGFTKAVLVVTDSSGKFEQDIPFEFLKESVEKLDGVEVGDEVEVTFDIRGNEYNGKYYCSLVGWKLKTQSKGGSVPQNSVPSDKFGEQVPEGDDDLPF